MKKKIIYLFALIALTAFSSCDKEENNVPAQDVSSHFTVERNKADKNYGGIESYLTNQLGVDLNKMKTLYTE